jgi:hypothetical protein
LCPCDPGWGSEQRVREILSGILKLPGAERSQALAQLAILCGLRPISAKLRMELDEMPVVIEISKNAILLDIQNKALEQGEAKGRAEGEAKGEARGEARGEAKGMQTMLRGLLETKFGPLPKRAAARLSKASTVDLEKWAKRTITAQTLNDVLDPA